MTQIFPMGGNALRMDFAFSWILFHGTVVTQASRSYVVDAIEGHRYVFGGEGLTYDSSGWPIGGTFRSFEFVLNGTTIYTQNGSFAMDSTLLKPALMRGEDPVKFLLPGADDLHGSEGDDFIVDPAGHNNFYGGGGNDTISAGAGNDHIYGRSAAGGDDGDDQIWAGDGANYVQGNAGDDEILAGSGPDRIQGGAGNDRIHAGDGNNIVNGNRGDDEIRAGYGDDLLRGGQGNDLIEGFVGNDTLMGDLGADYLIGGEGNDLFVFGPGTSTIASVVDEVTDRIADFERGIDHIDLGFHVEALLLGEIRSALSADHTIENARAVAQALFDAHPGRNEVAVIDSSGLLMFWSSSNGDIVDSVAAIGGYSTPITLDDFL